MKILDCTLRDGSYTNNSQWPEDVFKNIIKSLYGKVDIIEIGYRRPGKEGFEYCDDHYISRLLGKEYDNLALMIDCKDYLKVNVWIQDNFIKKEQSPITYVRCCCTIEQLEDAISMTKVLSALGYKTTINIMKCSLLLDDDWDKMALYEKNIKMDHLKYLYFADSFGVVEEINFIKMKNKKIGFHPHNNKNLAFALYKDSEFDIIDSSIAGLGRGAGNLDTIQVLLDRNHNLDYDLYKCLKYIEKIKKESQCGYSYEYHYCAINNIHPNYCVYLKGLHKYGRHEIIDILSKIPEEKRSHFNKGVFDVYYKE